MLFGLSNVSMAFQSLTNHLLRHYLWKFILVFFDDKLIYSTTVEEYLWHLQQLFEILYTNALHVNPKNCRFSQSQLFLKLGVQVDTSKVKDMVDWLTPRILQIRAVSWV